ncbi:MAG: hypothetical protein N3F09_03020 [Bacteroidia bacterium]|nr:hypothetical protein [Bacteroidia bacterium]
MLGGESGASLAKYPTDTVLVPSGMVDPEREIRGLQETAKKQNKKNKNIFL